MSVWLTMEDVVRYVLIHLEVITVPATVDMNLLEEIAMVTVATIIKFSFIYLDINECLNDTHLCEHNCYNTNGSYVCDCQPGYQLTNGLSCSDINECNTDNGGCSQVCINQVGSYYCQCNNGYTLDDDGHACTGMIVWITLNVYT